MPSSLLPRFICNLCGKERKKGWKRENRPLKIFTFLSFLCPLQLLWVCEIKWWSAVVSSCVSLGRCLHLSKLRFPHLYHGGSHRTHLVDGVSIIWEGLSGHVVSTREKPVTIMIMTHGWELLSPVRTGVCIVPHCVWVSPLGWEESRAGRVYRLRASFCLQVGSCGSLWGGVIG